MKKSQTFKTLKQRNTPFTWIVLVICFFFFVPSLLMDYIWINLKSVEIVQPTYDDGLIEMKVDREIHRKFRGSYTVTIRRISSDPMMNNEPVCVGKPLNPFPYDPSRILPEPLLLSWWLGSSEMMDLCKQKGFVAGNDFIIRTCHTIVLGEWEIPIARRCILSNEFTLLNEVKTEDL